MPRQCGPVEGVGKQQQAGAFSISQVATPIANKLRELSNRFDKRAHSKYGYAVP